ncbi:MAG TPA: Uma2 family endonuclease [Pyrinomonadaceae bacterium]|nr:Uma2 family endonuclease [Pyrinomonadaceae bacterium]
MNEKGFNHPVSKQAEEFFAKGSSGGNKTLAGQGSNRWHNLIASNLTIAIGSRVKGNKCEVYVNGMRVQLRSNLVCYPNLTIVNGEPVFTDPNSEILKNPTVVVEIISGNANPLEKMQKLEAYLAMESVKECVMVKADEMRVEHYARQNQKQWLYKIYNEREDMIALDAVNCKVSMAEIYSQINMRNAEISSTAVN